MLSKIHKSRTCIVHLHFPPTSMPRFYSIHLYAFYLRSFDIEVENTRRRLWKIVSNPSTQLNFTRLISSLLPCVHMRVSMNTWTHTNDIHFHPYPFFIMQFVTEITCWNLPKHCLRWYKLKHEKVKGSWEWYEYEDVETR